MTKKTHDLAIKTGTYTNREGEEKGRYLNIGSILAHEDGGISVKLNCIPVGLTDWEGWVSAFPVKKKDDAEEYRQQSAPTIREFDDDLPF